MHKKEPISVAIAKKEGETIPGSAPCAGPGIVNTTLRASTILKTIGMSVAWKRNQIPSFKVGQGNSSSSSDSGVDAARASNNELPTTQAVKLEATLIADGGIEIMERTLEYSAPLDLSSPDEPVWLEEDTLTQSPPTSESKTVVTPVVDSPLSPDSDWIQEGDINILEDAHLQIVTAISSALLETSSESALSPLSELVAYYEMVSISKAEVTPSVTSASSSVFLRTMSSSDFNLAHEEIFGLSLSTTPRTFIIV